MKTKLLILIIVLIFSLYQIKHINTYDNYDYDYEAESQIKKDNNNKKYKSEYLSEEEYIKIKQQEKQNSNINNIHTRNPNLDNNQIYQQHIDHIKQNNIHNDPDNIHRVNNFNLQNDNIQHGNEGYNYNNEEMNDRLNDLNGNNNNFNNDMYNNNNNNMPNMPGMPGMPRGYKNNNNFKNNPNKKDNNNESINNYNNEDRKPWYQKNAILYTFYEIMMAAFLFGFIWQCCCGRHENDKSVLHWYDNNKDILKERFKLESFFEEIDSKIDVNFFPTNEDYDLAVKKRNERVEEDKHNNEIDTNTNNTNTSNVEERSISTETNNKNKSYPIFKESSNNYRYLAKNPNMTHNGICTLDLKFDFRKKKDSMFIITQFLMNEQDRLVYELTLKTKEDYPNVLMICKESELRQINNYKDVSFFTEKQSLKNTGKIILAEDVDLVNHLFSDEVLKKNFYILKDIIEAVYYTDRKTFNKK